METSYSPLTTTTKSSLESLDPLVGSPDDSNSPSSPSPFPTINTTSNTTPSGSYLNHLHFVDTPAPTPTSLEENPSALAPAVIIVALPTHPSTTTTPNKQPSCPPHTTLVLTTLTLAPSGPPNLHHQQPSRHGQSKSRGRGRGASKRGKKVFFFKKNC